MLSKVFFHIKITSIAIQILVLFNPVQNAHADAGLSSTEREYFYQKSIGNYESSLALIREEAKSSEDVVGIDLHLLRIYELIYYSEMIDSGIRAYEDIVKNSDVVRSNEYLRERIALFKSMLLFRRGDTTALREFKKRFGYIDTFKIIGPFNNRNENEYYQTIFPGEGDHLSLHGKNYLVNWFNIRSNVLGVFNISKLFHGSGINNTLFFLYRDITITKSGSYRFMLGKTGYCDIWIDGIPIFSDRREHGYFSDQYFMDVFIPEGRHRIVIKIGTFKDDVRFSLRFSPTDTVSGDPAVKGDTDKENGKVKKISANYFQTLANLLEGDLTDPYRAFLVGYIFYMCHLNDLRSSETRRYLLVAEKMPSLSSVANYYIGMTEKDEINREHYLDRAIKINRRNIEALSQIARIKLKANFVYEANRVIDAIAGVKRNAIQLLVLRADLFTAFGWYEEALKTARLLRNTPYPSTGYLIEGRIFEKRSLYQKALHAYRKVYESEKGNLRSLMQTVHCAIGSGDLNTARALLEEAVLNFPNTIRIRLLLSSLIERLHGVGASLPYLSSMITISPFNVQVLMRTGIAYHKTGRDDLARYYLKRASLSDPKNFSLRRYLNIINRTRSEIEDLLWNKEIIALLKRAERYSNEPAIVLLDEVAIRVFPDGSSEKRIHKIVRINDKSVIDDFAYQYIILNPRTDSIEEVQCFVINDGNAVEVTNYYTQSLSDPGSRLYYDLQARIISIPSLRKGSVIDLKYVIRKRKDEAYKKYFGEKITIGDEYRTIITNITCSFPKGKGIGYYLKDVRKEQFRVYSRRHRNIYHLSLENIPSYKDETAMPHYSEVLPAVFFTSFRDWSEIHHWYMSLVRDRFQVSHEMKSVLNALISRGDSPEEKVRKVYNHVVKQIRYVGFEFGIGGIQPRSSDITYRTRMGDCKDISLVLIAMLREVGIDARLALVRTRDKGRAYLQVPYLGEFNHAICYVGNGMNLFLDGTSKFSGIRELPQDDSEVTALVLDDGGYDFIPVRNKLYYENVERVVTDVSIDRRGNAELYRRLQKQGSLALRSRFELLDDDKKIKTISAYWNKLYTGSNVHELKIERAAYDEPVVYTYRVSIPSFVSRGAVERGFNSFLISSEYYRSYAMIKKRTHPLEMAMKWDSHITIRYRLPADCKVLRIPRSEKFRHSKFEALFSYRRFKEENIVEVKSVLRFKAYRIEVSEYGIFREFTRFIHRKENERIIFIFKEN